MTKDAYWFKHDSNAQDDPKCMTLIDQLGMEGYGIFWALIEKLRNESEFKLHISVCSSLAKRWCTSKEKVEAVVLKYGLFSIENDYIFYSERLSQSMNYRKRIATENANKRWGNEDATALQPHSNGIAVAMPTDATAMLREERRGEENREEREKIYSGYVSFLNRIVGKKYRGDSKSKSQLFARLNGGYKNEDIKQAIVNASKDQFHIDNKFKYLTPDFFTRADKIDKFMNIETTIDVLPKKIDLKNPNEYVNPSDYFKEEEVDWSQYPNHPLNPKNKVNA